MLVEYVFRWSIIAARVVSINITRNQLFKLFEFIYFFYIFRLIFQFRLPFPFLTWYFTTWIFYLQRNAIERGWEALVYSYLTNKEASTVLCSVVKHADSGRARKKCRGKHETQLIIINRGNSVVFSVVVLFLKYNFCFRNRSFWYLSSKNLLGWEFISLSVFVGI